MIKSPETWEAVEEFLYDTDEKGSGAGVQGLDKKGITDRPGVKMQQLFFVDYRNSGTGLRCLLEDII